MSLSTQGMPTQQQAGIVRRIWHVPVSRARWLWLSVCALCCAVILVLYIHAIETQAFPGPLHEPLRSFGIVAFCLVLAAASYTLRRRFARGLPGKVQDWLWMHIWVGWTGVLIVLLHENFLHILHDYCQNMSCLTESYAGTSALLALALLVITGIIGRLLDMRQARLIALDASTNGAGIARGIEERMLELEYVIERLCAGKSEVFQTYCMGGIEHAQASALENVERRIPTQERADFVRAKETLLRYAQLAASLQRQQRGRLMMRSWRYVHIVLASLALLIILYHCLMETAVNLLHL